jgi:hypothetical protein
VSCVAVLFFRANRQLSRHRYYNFHFPVFEMILQIDIPIIRERGSQGSELKTSRLRSIQRYLMSEATRISNIPLLRLNSLEISSLAESGSSQQENKTCFVLEHILVTSLHIFHPPTFSNAWCILNHVRYILVWTYHRVMSMTKEMQMQQMGNSFIWTQGTTSRIRQIIVNVG